MSLSLTFLLSFPLIGMTVWIVRAGGPHFYVYVWAFMFVVSILMLTIYPTLIAPLFNKYTKLDQGETSYCMAHLLSPHCIAYLFFPLNIIRHFSNQSY